MCSNRLMQRKSSPVQDRNFAFALRLLVHNGQLRFGITRLMLWSGATSKAAALKMMLLHGTIVYFGNATLSESGFDLFLSKSLRISDNLEGARKIGLKKFG